MNKVLDTLRQEYVEYKSPLSDLLSQPPEAILKAVHRWLEVPAAQPESDNWLLLAEVAKARVRQDTDNDLIWAEIAIVVYEHLSVVEPQYHHENLLDAMLLRVSAIENHGNKVDDLVCDVIRVTRWGLQHELTLKEAQSAFNQWNVNGQRDKQVLESLDKVRVLLRLSDAGFLERDANIDGWANLEDVVARRFFNRT